tara:strand:- start:4829 stop:7144 length:2316 start_codon:yes stop_codon:yes gene_type:complete
VDFHDGTELERAIIIVKGTNKEIITDFNGSFSISNLCNESYILEISHPQCKTKELKIKVFENINKTIRLEHHVEELNEIIIYGNSFNEKSKTLIENKISSETLENYIGATLGDVLNNLSGVSSLNSGNSVVKPIINGLHSSRVVIINNGVRMEDQEWGAEHAPNIDINSIDNITLIKGAGALQYSGNALGGVIVAEAPDFKLKDSLYGKTIIRAATNGQGATTTSKLTKTQTNGLYSSAQLTFKRFGDFKAPNYVLTNTGVLERNASFRLGLNRYNYGLELYYSIFKNEIGILKASHIHTARDQLSSINSEIPLIINDFSYKINSPKQDVTHHILRFKWFKRFEGLGKLSLQYDFQRNNRLEYDVRIGVYKNIPSTDLKLETHSIMVDLDTQFNNSIKFKTGIIGRFQDNFASPKTGVRRIIPDYDKYDLGIYTIADFRVNDKLLFEVGSRFDYSYMDVFKFYRKSFWNSRGYQDIFPEIIVEEEFNNQILTNPKFTFYNFSTTFGSRYTFDESRSILFNYSIASRIPNPSELFSEGLHHASARFEIGDLRFNSEVGHKIALTFKLQNKNLNLSINPYINTIKDFILIEPTQIQQTIRGNFQVWEYRQTNAQLFGLDIDASFALNENVFLDNQFSFIKGNDLIKNEPLISIPPVNINNEIVYQNPNLNNLRLALKSEYVFRQNEYPDNNFEVFEAVSQTTELVDVSTPPNAYHLFNFNSSINIKVEKNYRLDLNFDINNLLNKQYRNYLNRLRYYAHDLGRNIILGFKYNY